MEKTLIEQMIEQNGGSSVFPDPMPGSYRMIDLNAPIPRFLVDVEEYKQKNFRDDTDIIISVSRF